MLTLGTVVVFACLFLCMPALAQAGEQGIAITAIKPYHYEWSEDDDIARGSPWFNLENYVEVTVENNRNATVESFEVTLYTDDEPIGSKPVEGLSADDTIDVSFEWEPEGEDPLSWEDSAEGAILSYTDTNKIYTLRAVVVEDGKEIAENETNQKVAWNGYMADAPLEIYEHDTVKGGLVYTTGDGQYRSGDSGDDGTKYGTSYDINYDLEIEDGAKLARMYIYYTWSKPKQAGEPKAPKVGVTLETPSGNSEDLSMEKSYNDIKGDLPEPYGTYKYHAWGTYAYDITDYIKESGTYVVSVTNQNDGSDDDFATAFSFAPPAILVVYEDTTAPEREYWILEGADILIGGRRGDAGFLDLEECLNEAEFPGEHLDLAIEEAVLCVVSPWADDSEDDVIYFNGREQGRGLYRGYHHDWSSSEDDIKGISMSIGTEEAQIGIAAIDVTKYLDDYDNEVVQGDDGDNMMPANAFLVITYEKEEEEEEGGDGTAGSPGITAWGPVESVVNNTEGESRTFNISVNQTVDISWQINGTEVQTDEVVTEADYTNTNAVAGTWNVSVIATSAITELHDLHTWIWNVTPAPTATPTPALNITTTPISTPTLVPTTTPKPKPVLTHSSEEKEVVAGAPAEAETPGFELVTSLFILLLVAYLIRRR
uniref:Uncharacterized protein n=1 Tax=Candidatus Methanophaga sp. ANME-1 ERB7 TaxID=2759913 RepID=A0A7G9Z9I9_9EURY|nr:hypothetical protein KMABBJJO_00002 [Methanosarcinales archaeon ANME-1 ERB7]